MSFNNKIPSLGRISQDIRDNDFIMITELKEFNTILDEVIVKLSETEGAEDSANIKQQIKNIEYNLLGAIEVIEKDGVKEYIYKTDIDSVTGEVIPKKDAVKKSIDTITQDLEDCMMRLYKLCGENLTDWSIAVQNHLDEAMKNFEARLQNLYINSLNSLIIEEKENISMDYTKQDSVKLTENSIFKLNPDLSAYVRHINLKLNGSEKTRVRETIVADIYEQEQDSLVLDFNITNGKLYKEYSLINDPKDKTVHIIDKKGLNCNEFDVTLKIYKYLDNENVNHYVLTINSENPEAYNDMYSFEFNGVFVGGYKFNVSGFPITEGLNYSSFQLLELKGDELPNKNTDYYIKTIDKTNTDEEVFVYNKVENLNIFDFTKEYYIKVINYELVKEIDIKKTDALVDNVNIDNTDVDGNKPTDLEFQTVLDDTKYNNSKVAVKRINFEPNEVFAEDTPFDIDNTLRNHSKEYKVRTYMSRPLEPVSEGGKKMISIDNKPYLLNMLRSGCSIHVPFWGKGKDISSYPENFSEYISLMTSPDNSNNTHPLFEMMNDSIKENFKMMIDKYGEVNNETELFTFYYNDKNNPDEKFYGITYYDTELSYDNIDASCRSLYKVNPETGKLDIAMSDKNNPLSYNKIVKVQGELYALSNSYIDKYLLAEYPDVMKYFILKYNPVAKEFEPFDKIYSTLKFEQIPFVDYIHGIEIHTYGENIVAFFFHRDGIYELEESYPIFVNYGVKTETIPEKIGFPTYSEISKEDISDKTFISIDSNHIVHIAIDSEYKFYYSYDAMTWYRKSELDGIFDKVYWDGYNFFYALRRDRGEMVYMSNDGLNWSTTVIDHNGPLERSEGEDKQFEINDIKYTGINRLFLLTNYGIYLNVDGETFKRMDMFKNENVKDVCWNRVFYVALGENKSAQFGEEALSSNLITKVPNITTMNESCNNVCCYEEYGIIASGLSGVWYINSVSGKWSKVLNTDSPVKKVYTTHLESAISDAIDGYYFAVLSDNIYYSSKLGNDTWNKYYADISIMDNIRDDLSINNIKVVGDINLEKAVMMTNFGIFISLDFGTNWTRVNSIDPTKKINYTDVAFCNNTDTNNFKFVFIGENNGLQVHAKELLSTNAEYAWVANKNIIKKIWMCNAGRSYIIKTQDQFFAYDRMGKTFIEAPSILGDVRSSKDQDEFDNFQFVTVPATDKLFPTLYCNSFNDKVHVINADTLDYEPVIMENNNVSRIRRYYNEDLYTFRDGGMRFIFDYEEIGNIVPSKILIDRIIHIFDINNYNEDYDFIIIGKDKYDGKMVIYRMYFDPKADRPYICNELLRTDVIDYINQLSDGSFVISAYLKDTNTKYKWDSDRKTFVSEDIIDINKTYSFNDGIEYKDKFYFINGSGSDTRIKQFGACRLEYNADKFFEAVPLTTVEGDLLFTKNTKANFFKYNDELRLFISNEGESRIYKFNDSTQLLELDDVFINLIDGRSNEIFDSCVCSESSDYFYENEALDSTDYRGQLGNSSLFNNFESTIKLTAVSTSNNQTLFIQLCRSNINNATDKNYSFNYKFYDYENNIWRRVPFDYINEKFINPIFIDAKDESYFVFKNETTNAFIKISLENMLNGCRTELREDLKIDRWIFKDSVVTDVNLFKEETLGTLRIYNDAYTNFGLAKINNELYHTNSERESIYNRDYSFDTIGDKIAVIYGQSMIKPINSEDNTIFFIMDWGKNLKNGTTRGYRYNINERGELIQKTYSTIDILQFDSDDSATGYYFPRSMTVNMGEKYYNYGYVDQLIPTFKMTQNYGFNKLSDTTNSIIKINKEILSKDFGKFIDMYGSNSNDDKYYDNVCETSVGLFRFNTKETYWNVDRFDEDNNTGFCYFTPIGTNKLITISAGPAKKVHRIYETSAGIFFSIKDYEWFGVDAVEIFTLYRLEAIPQNEDTRVMINNTNYFRKCYCEDVQICEMKDTQYGTFAIGFLDIKRVVFKYNGSDFYKIGLYDGTINPYTGIMKLFDTTQGLFMLSSKVNDYVYKYNKSTDTFDSTGVQINLSSYLPYDWINTIEFAGHVIISGMRGNIKLIRDFTTNKEIVLDSTANTGDLGLPYLGNINLNPDKLLSTKYENKLVMVGKYLVEEGLPVDIDLKATGTIIVNGFNVDIDGVRIITKKETGMVDDTKNPVKTVKFSISKHAKFCKLILNTYKPMTDNVVNRLELNIDYITDTSTNIINIGRMNFTVLFNDNEKVIDTDFDNIMKESFYNKYLANKNYGGNVFINQLNNNYDLTPIGYEVGDSDYDEDNISIPILRNGGGLF